MKALLLGAGEGTRLRPLTLTRPKPMLPVGGRPLLEYLVGLLRHHGIREIAINVHYKPDVIVDYFGDGSRFDVSITYSHEPHLLGSAGAAKKLEGFLTEPFLVLYGDVMTDVDLTKLVAGHKAFGGLGTLALYEVEDPTRCGIVQLDAEQRVTHFVEKPHRTDVRSNLANAGIYVLQPAILDYIEPGAVADFGRDIFPLVLKSGEALFGMSPNGYLLDIGSPERYAQAEADLLAGRFQSRVNQTHRAIAVGSES